MLLPHSVARVVVVAAAGTAFKAAALHARRASASAARGAQQENKVPLPATSSLPRCSVVVPQN